MPPHDELQALREDWIRHKAQNEERWGEAWRAKESHEDRLQDLEERVTTMARDQASSDAETRAMIRAESRWSSFYGTIAGGITIAVASGLVMLLFRAFSHAGSP